MKIETAAIQSAPVLCCQDEIDKPGRLGIVSEVPSLGAAELSAM